jgi:hypothetical protein
MIRQSITYTTLIISLFLGLLCNSLSAGDSKKNPSYREVINIHLGRETYISGESIWYKAYCFSNQANPSEFLSKAAYVELINEKYQPVLAQVLEINGNCGSSMMHLPDTLATGLYYLTAYTQWMRNFGKESFFSAPVFIYNQYDEHGTNALSSYILPLSPRYFVEGGKMVAGTENKIIIQVAGLFGKQISGAISETYSDAVLSTFKTDRKGVSCIQLTPLAGRKYSLILGDSIVGKKIFEFPQAVAGYSIHPIAFDGEKITLSLHFSNDLQLSQAKLLVYAGGKIVAESTISLDAPGKEISLAVPSKTDPDIRLQLQTLKGDVLATLPVLLTKQDPIAISLSDTIFGIREQVALGLNIPDFESDCFTGFSVSVFKDKSSVVSDSIQSEASVEGNYGILPQNSLITFFSEVVLPSNGNSYFTAGRDILPVEDIGILYTGKVVNSGDNTPLIGVDVELAILDSVASIKASRTDSSGSFILLTNGFGNNKGMIELKHNEKVMNGNYSIEVDDKFIYGSADRSVSLSLMNEPQFVSEMKDEAQRVLIQKAFLNTDPSFPVFLTDSISKVPFYGTPLITVFPVKYIELPNFEEIAREILPRVRYKKNKTGCEFYVIDVENNVRSDLPIILLDGVPVTSICDLYPLASDDINKIEIQSGYHISGNLLYNGLVAVYTTSQFKEKNKENDSRFNLVIPGYVNDNSTYSVPQLDSKPESILHPDFRNQLYWDPYPALNLGDKGSKFYTTDEDGNYMIDVVGYTKSGFPVHIQKTFVVADH